MKRKQFNVGDRVAYARGFLRSTLQLTGAAPFARGTVVGVEPLYQGRDLLRVRWDADDAPVSVLDCNLVHVDALPREEV